MTDDDPMAPPRRRPMEVALDEDDAAAPSPQNAPPPAGVDTGPEEAQAPAPRPLLSRAMRVFLAAGGALGALGLALSVDELIRSLWAASPWLAYPAMAVTALAVLAGLVLITRELAALGRIRRVGALRSQAAAARSGGDAAAARRVAAGVGALYADAPALDGVEPLTSAARRRLADHARDAADAPAILDLYERALLADRDAAARAAIRRAARRVATATALMPSALLDGIAALYLNIALIRRLAEIYGGRAGVVGSLRLARRVVEHAMAVGLIALGDDLLEPLLGGGVASRVSRRLGEGVVNGAMTARIGLAAADLCRPMPFQALQKPKLRDVAWEALSRK